MPEKGEKQRISRALDSASMHAKILRSRPPLPCPSPAASRDGLRLDFNSEPYHVQSGDISSIAIVGSSGVWICDAFVEMLGVDMGRVQLLLLSVSELVPRYHGEMLMVTRP